MSGQRRRRRGTGRVTKSFIDGATIISDQTSYNFGNFTIPRDGLVVAVFTALGSSSRTVASISIGGTNGALVTGTSSVYKVAIGSREVAAGTHNVTCVLSGANGFSSNAAVAVYLLEGYASPTAYDSDTSADTTSTAYTASLDTPGSGAAFFGAVRVGTAVDGTWSSADNDYEATLNGGSGNRQHEFASRLTSTEAPSTETVTYSSSEAGRIAAASWA